MTEFNYKLAFSRNLGFVSKEEQEIISKTRIGIPGMGGVGGHHLHTLARMGYRHFHIADFDEFDIHNFNRQIGATVKTVGRPKAQVMKEMILDIIPDAEIQIFEDGVNDSNRSQFLDGLDFLVDGLDVYVIKERIKLFDKAYELGIPVLTAGPLGMGSCLLKFMPGKMKFSDYFNINIDMNEKEMLSHFLAGINPRPYFLKYLFFKEEIDIANGKAPSLHVGVLAATTLIGAEVVKLSLKRGPMTHAPSSIQYDYYLQKMKKNWIPFGNKNPLQKVIIFFIKRIIKKS